MFVHHSFYYRGWTKLKDVFAPAVVPDLPWYTSLAGVPMADSLKDEVPKLMDRLGISGQQLQNVKLGPGVVGRNSSIAWVAGIVMLAGVIGGVWLHNPVLV